MKPVKIGTRGSKLALFQANLVKQLLEEKFPDRIFELEIIKTKGDKILDVALSKIGDKGLFTKEIEVALQEGEVDLAVHSLKDLPTVLPTGLILGGVLEREDPADALITKTGEGFDSLSGKILATSSLRRKAQIMALNKNITIVDIRGNVDSRLKKMEEGYCDATILATAGLNRLGLTDKISQKVPFDILLPAVSQGIIGIEIRENDPATQNLINAINHTETYLSAQAERAFLNTLEGGCQIPIGCNTYLKGNQFYITGLIASVDGKLLLKETVICKPEEAVDTAKKLAKKLFDNGGEEILKSIRNENQV